MLATYPLNATSDNWFHDCVMDMISAIHNAVKNDLVRPDWMNSVPAIHKETVRPNFGLNKKLKGYFEVVSDLCDDEIDVLENALTKQNEIEQLLAANAACDCASDFHAMALEKLAELMKYAFKKLTDFGIRDTHYKAIYDSLSAKVCPFCGCEEFDSPKSKREDLDHYIPISLYPFAGSNLRNLAPMGMKCNERYKGANNILKDGADNTRSAFDPYLNETAKLSLINSAPLQVDAMRPDWDIQLIGDNDKVTTWDDVFDIRRRWKDDVLDVNYSNWITAFVAYCRDSSPTDIGTLITQLDNYILFLEVEGLNDKAFLKLATFKMIHHHCNNGDDELIAFMLNTLRN